MPKIIDSIAHAKRVDSRSVTYDRSALRDIGDLAAWSANRLVDDILIGKAAEFMEQLPWEYDGRSFTAMLFDRDTAISYHIESALDHAGTGQKWVLSKSVDGYKAKPIGKFASGPDFYDEKPIEEAKRVALDDWNRTYSNPSEKSYLHLAKTNRDVLRAAIRNDSRGDVIIRAQLKGPGGQPPLETKPDELGLSDNGNQPAGTGTESKRTPLDTIPGTGVIGVGVGNMGIAAQAAPPAPPAPPAEAPPPAPEGAPPAQAAPPAAPAPEAPPVDDGLSIIDAIQNAQDALDQVKQKVDSGETVLDGKEVESIADPPEAAIQPEVNSPAQATPVMAQVKPQEPGLDLPSDDELDSAFDNATSEHQQPPVQELLAVYNSIKQQAAMLKKQLADLDAQGKAILVDHLAPIMRQMDNQQAMLDNRIYKLVEWSQGSTAYSKVLEELVLLGNLDAAQLQLIEQLKAANTNPVSRKEIRDEGPAEKQGDAGMGMDDAGVLSSLNAVIDAYAQINAYIDTMEGEGMTIGAAIDADAGSGLSLKKLFQLFVKEDEAKKHDPRKQNLAERNVKWLNRQQDKGYAAAPPHPSRKKAVDDEAAEYYEDYYGPYGESLVEDKIAMIFELAKQAGIELSDEQVAACVDVLGSRPVVHGAYIRYATSSTNPSMGEMLDMVFELSQSDSTLSKELDRITVKQLLRTSDFLNRMSFEDQKQILLRAMRGDARFVNKIKKLYNKALGIEEPKPVEAPVQTEPQPPVPQAGPEILTAALEITAAGMPKMTNPTVRKGEDDAVDVIKMEDAAKDYKGPTPGTIDFKIDKQNMEGNYLFMAVSWEPEQVKLGGQGLELALKKFVQSVVSHRAPVNYGYSYTGVIKHLDPKKGNAVIQVKIRGDANAPLAIAEGLVSDIK